MRDWHLLLLAFLLPLGILRAESNIRIKGIESRVDRLEKSQPAGDRIDRFTPCAGPRVKNGMDLSISADFIYWTARVDTLTYGKTGYGNLQEKGAVQSVKWSWDPGFKAGLGWSFCHGCWDMNLQYTWFYTSASDRKDSTSLLPSYAMIPPEFSSDQIAFDRGEALFGLHYQVGDLELGRNYYVSRTLKLRPFIGIKGTWQKQAYKVSYEGTSIIEPHQPLRFGAKFDQAFWGLGMRGGLKTSWQFSRHISLYGDLALTGIWLDYHIDRKDTFQIADTETTPFQTQAKLQGVKPVMEFGIGLRGESYLENGRYHILVQGGWESQIWVNQTLHITKNRHYERFDLNLHGFIGKIRFDF